MTRIFFIIIALAFVQLVNGQGACITAQTNLAGNTACVSAFSIGTDTDTICMGTCRDLFDAIISNCDAEVSQTKYYCLFISKATNCRLLVPVTRPHCNFRAACIFIITFGDHSIKFLLLPPCC